MPAPQYAQMSPRRDEADDADPLLQRVAGGDRDALGALYRRHAHVVLAQIRLAVGEPGLSEEILQDTMLAVWQGAGSFRGGSQVRSWIIAIALRQARDRLRRRRLAVVADEHALSGQAAADPGPEAQVLERAELAVVGEAIRSLSPGHREVLGAGVRRRSDAGGCGGGPRGAGRDREEQAGRGPRRAGPRHGRKGSWAMMIGEQAHLGVAELTGLANGAPLGTAAGAHLDSCPDCQAEARSWSVIAAGVRTVMAETPAPAAALDGVLAAIGDQGTASGRPRLAAASPAAKWPRRGVPGWHPAAAAAVTVAVLGGGGWG